MLCNFYYCRTEKELYRKQFRGLFDSAPVKCKDNKIRPQPTMYVYCKNIINTFIKLV